MSLVLVKYSNVECNRYRSTSQAYSHSTEGHDELDVTGADYKGRIAVRPGLRVRVIMGEIRGGLPETRQVRAKSSYSHSNSPVTMQDTLKAQRICEYGGPT